MGFINGQDDGPCRKALHLATILGLALYGISWQRGMLCKVNQAVEATRLVYPQTKLHSAATTIKDDTAIPAAPINRRLEPFSRSPRSFKESLKWIVAGRRDSKATYVQVGANDGQMYDPFHGAYFHRNSTDYWHHHWMGLLVEPQPELYSQLAVFHADAQPIGWAFYHGALAPPTLCKNGTIEFCETKTPGVGGWETQGQINTITKARCSPSNTEMHLKKRPCVSSFSQLLQHASPQFRSHTWNEHNGSYNIDFLQIDVEGADYGILQMIDWNVLKPQCIHYEQLHLGKNKANAKAFVESQGYTVLDREMDVLACLVEQEKS